MESDNEDLAPRRVQGQDKAERDQEIRRLFNSGLKQVEIARRMGISNSVVWVVPEQLQGSKIALAPGHELKLTTHPHTIYYMDLCLIRKG